MKIIELRSENIKRLKAVEIRPEGNMVVIGGRNGQGKSSVLDSIEMALAGKDHIPTRPIRHGEAEACIELMLDDLVVRRTFTQKNSYLTVQQLNGGPVSSPQKLLDKLVGKLSFDPLEFARMDSKHQLQQLQTLVGLDVSDLETQHQHVYASRSDVHRDIKRLEGALASMPYYPEVSETEVSLTQFSEELIRRRSVNEHNQRERQALEQMRERASDLKREIQHLEEHLAKLRDLLDEVTLAGKHQRTKVEALQDEHEQSLIEQIHNLEAFNTQARANAARLQMQKQIAALRQEEHEHTQQLTAIEVEKARLLAEAKFPVSGLSFDQEHVLFNGLPFSQASRAEQIRVSVAIGLALNPTLRVLLIRDGSLLDDNSLADIARMAAEADAQVWIERVGEGESASIIIEDGRITTDKNS